MRGTGTALGLILLLPQSLEPALGGQGGVGRGAGGGAQEEREMGGGRGGKGGAEGGLKEDHNSDIDEWPVSPSPSGHGLQASEKS